MKKSTLLLILLLAVGLVLPSVSYIKAAARPTDRATQQQIHILLAQITELKGRIADLTLPPRTYSDAYTVVDLSSGSVLACKNPNQAYPIASITKLMNAVVALENTDINQNITLTEEMLRPEGHSPSLFLNLNISLKNLLKAALIQSTNDAAESISYAIGNPQFIALMNQKAKQLGMNDTVYYDVHGLNPDNHSTPSDLAKLVSYIYTHHPEILAITKETNFQLPDPDGRLLTFQNLNNFSKRPDFIGGKTGYLPEAKQSLASVFNVSGKPVAIVLLHSTSRQKDTLRILDWLKNNLH
jgi:D-alanyl-D-alanine endopeptidase (penicillin-binding protein 7)